MFLRVCVVISDCGNLDYITWEDLTRTRLKSKKIMVRSKYNDCITWLEIKLLMHQTSIDYVRVNNSGAGPLARASRS